jgi:hypothetical protein
MFMNMVTKKSAQSASSACAIERSLIIKWEITTILAKNKASCTWTMAETALGTTGH